MKSLKIISLMLGLFCFSPLLAIANPQTGSCRSAIENLGAEEVSSKEIKSMSKDLDKYEWDQVRNLWYELTKHGLEEAWSSNSPDSWPSWEHILFWDSELKKEWSPLEIAQSIEKNMNNHRNYFGTLYEIIENFINQKRELIPQEWIVELPPDQSLVFPVMSTGDKYYLLLVYLSKTTEIFNNNLPLRKAFLIEAMDAENSKMVAILKGMGADVYMGSPYNAETLSMMRGVVGSARDPHNFRIKYPIPLALEKFSANFNNQRISQIVEILLDGSDPNFRYNHSEMDKQFGLFEVEYPGNPKIDRELIYGVRDGASDLMLVAQYGTPEMLKSLIEGQEGLDVQFLSPRLRHDVTARDKEGWGVEDYAQLNRQHGEEILALLKEYKTQETVESPSEQASRLKTWFSSVFGK